MHCTRSRKQNSSGFMLTLDEIERINEKTQKGNKRLKELLKIIGKGMDKLGQLNFLVQRKRLIENKLR